MYGVVSWYSPCLNHLFLRSAEQLSTCAKVEKALYSALQSIEWSRYLTKTLLTRSVVDHMQYTLQQLTVTLVSRKVSKARSAIEKHYTFSLVCYWLIVHVLFKVVTKNYHWLDEAKWTKINDDSFLSCYSWYISYAYPGCGTWGSIITSWTNGLQKNVEWCLSADV